MIEREAPPNDRDFIEEAEMLQKTYEAERFLWRKLHPGRFKEECED